MTQTLQIDCWTFQQAQILQQALVEIGVASSLENYSTRANDSPNVHLWVHLSTLDSLSTIKAIATQHVMTTIVDRHQQTQYVFMTLTNNELPAGQDITERGWLQPDVGTRFLRVCIETRDGEHEYSDTCVAVCPPNIQPEDVAHGIAYSWRDNFDHSPVDRDCYWFESCCIAVSVESVEVISRSDYDVLRRYLAELEPTELEIQQAIACRRGEPTHPDLSDLDIEQDFTDQTLFISGESGVARGVRKAATPYGISEQEDLCIDVQTALAQLRQQIEDDRAEEWQDAEWSLLKLLERVGAFPHIPQIHFI